MNKLKSLCYLSNLHYCLKSINHSPRHILIMDQFEPKTIKGIFTKNFDGQFKQTCVGFLKEIIDICMKCK